MSGQLKVIIYYKHDPEKPGHMIDVEFAFRSYNFADLEQIRDRVPMDYARSLIGDSSICSFFCSFFVESSLVILKSPFTTVIECENFITNLLQGYKYIVYSEDQTSILNAKNPDEIWNIKQVLGYPLMEDMQFNSEDPQNYNKDIGLVMDVTVHREDSITFICRAFKIEVNHNDKNMSFYSYGNNSDDRNKEAFIKYSKILKYWFRDCGYTLTKSRMIEYHKNNRTHYQQIIYFDLAGDIYAKNSEGKSIFDQKLIDKITIIQALDEAKTKEVDHVIKSYPTF